MLAQLTGALKFESVFQIGLHLAHNGEFHRLSTLESQEHNDASHTTQ